MKVLDFGPGRCETSHFLTQKGCKVYACDISPSALEIGKARGRPPRLQPLVRRDPVTQGAA